MSQQRVANDSKPVACSHRSMPVHSAFVRFGLASTSISFTVHLWRTLCKVVSMMRTQEKIGCNGFSDLKSARNKSIGRLKSGLRPSYHHREGTRIYPALTISATYHQG